MGAGKWGQENTARENAGWENAGWENAGWENAVWESDAGQVSVLKHVINQVVKRVLILFSQERSDVGQGR
jgi:hypothetical protein